MDTHLPHAVLDHDGIAVSARLPGEPLPLPEPHGGTDDICPPASGDGAGPVTDVHPAQPVPDHDEVEFSDHLPGGPMGSETHEAAVAGPGSIHADHAGPLPEVSPSHAAAHDNGAGAGMPGEPSMSVGRQDGAAVAPEALEHDHGGDTEAAKDGEPTHAVFDHAGGPPTARLPGEPTAGETIRPASSADAGADTGASAAAGAGAIEPEAAERLPTSERPPRKRRRALLLGAAAVAIVAGGAGVFLISPDNHVYPVPQMASAVRRLAASAGVALPKPVAPAASLASVALPPPPPAVIRDQYTPEPQDREVKEILALHAGANAAAKGLPDPAQAAPAPSPESSSAKPTQTAASRSATAPLQPAPSRTSAPRDQAGSGAPPGYVASEPGSQPAAAPAATAARSERVASVEPAVPVAATRYDGMALVSRLDPKARYRQYGSPAAPSNEAASCRGGSRRDDRDHDVWRLRAGLLAHDLRAVLAWAHDVKDVPCSQIDLGEVESLRGIASIAQNRRLPVYHADGAAFLDVTDMPEELASPLLRYLGETAGYDPSVPYQQQSSPEPDRQHGYILFAARPSLRDFLA